MIYVHFIQSMVACVRVDDMEELVYRVSVM